MSETDYRLPVSGINNGSGLVWSNPSFIITQNDSGATRAVEKSNTCWLVGYNFGFANVIPENATIEGIEAIMRRKSDDIMESQPPDINVQLGTYNGSVFTAIGSNLASALRWPTIYENKIFGGATNMWGTSLTRADIVSSAFALGLIAFPSCILDVDAFKLKIYYKAGSKAFMHHYRNLMAGGVGRQC